MGLNKNEFEYSKTLDSGRQFSFKNNVGDHFSSDVHNSLHHNREKRIELVGFQEKTNYLNFSFINYSHFVSDVL